MIYFTADRICRHLLPLSHVLAEVAKVCLGAFISVPPVSFLNSHGTNTSAACIDLKLRLLSKIRQYDAGKSIAFNITICQMHEVQTNSCMTEYIAFLLSTQVERQKLDFSSLSRK